PARPLIANAAVARTVTAPDGAGISIAAADDGTLIYAATVANGVFSDAATPPATSAIVDGAAIVQRAVDGTLTATALGMPVLDRFVHAPGLDCAAGQTTFAASAPEQFLFVNNASGPSLTSFSVSNSSLAADVAIDGTDCVF